MKKKTVFAFSLAAGIAFATTSSIADHNVLNAASPMMPGPTILRIITTTPNGKQLKADEMKLFVGQSCAALTNSMDFYSTDYDYVTVDSEEDNLSSEDLIEAFGPRLGCFKVDIVLNGKTVSTGAIALTWDGHQYVAANPSSTTMNF